MGVLSTLMRGLIRGPDRMSELSSRKVLSIWTMIPEFVVPHLEGFKLKPYISYRSLKGTEALLTAQSLFAEAVAPQIKKGFEEGTFSKDQLEKYGFESTQEEKLFKLYPKNYMR